MRDKKDQLVSQLSGLLQAVAKSGDGTRLLDHQVRQLAAELARALAHDPLDAAVPGAVEAVAVLVGVHWLRYRGLPEGQDQDDLRACLAWSAVLLPIEPSLVPGPVRAYLADHDPPAVDAADEADQAAEAAEAGPDDPVERGTRLFEGYQRTGSLRLLDAAIGCFLEAVDATEEGDPDRPAVLGALATTLLAHFRHAGGPLELDQAIGYRQAAADATPYGDPERAGRLSNLGRALRIRFELTGLDADLEQAIAAGRDAVGIAPAGHPDRPVMLVNLGGALQWRFERTGLRADLDETLGYLREAVAATPAGHPDRPMTLAALGSALGAGYEKTGRGADLEEAVRCLLEAADAAPVSNPDRPRTLANLGTLLRNRFRSTGQRPDLDQAVTFLREAVAATSRGHAERPSRLSSLGSALWSLFELTAHQADLDEAIGSGREAVSTAPAGHPDRLAMLANLGIALHSRFKSTGQEADLAEAITCFRAAADAGPASHALRPMALSNLGAALRSRFARSGQEADLAEAVTCFRTAAGATPASHPERAGILFNLGQALRARFEHTRQQPDLDGAIAAFQEGASSTTGLPGQRVNSAVGWAECEMEAGRPRRAVPGYAAAIDLLPLAVWHGLDQKTREHRLQEWAGLASDAAAAAVAADQPTLAVELLEQGRTVLWTQAMHLRQDLSVLRHQAPELAATLEASAALLNASPGLQPTSDPSAALEKRRQAARDWDAAVAQIRRLADFGDFLRPVPFAGLRGAAAEGPVAIINVSRHGSHALIVTPEGRAPSPAVLVVNLPDAPRTTVIEQVNGLLVALFNAGNPDMSLAAARNDRKTMFDVLAWTWRTLTEPVLNALGYPGTPPGAVEEWPRVWWCPTGPAAILPLHAAGHHPSASPQRMAESAALADTVPGRVVSSYTQTLTSLIRARARPGPGRVRQLAVGVPETLADTGGGYLPAVVPELEAVGRHLPEPEFATHLVGSAATKDAVVTALPEHSWLHLSCHGIQHGEDPSLSAFLLRDQPLTLADIAALSLPETDLAYLAACQTATGHVRLLDEALHLAGALQLVGYRHVLASMWSVFDMAAPTLADVFYAHLLAADPDRPGPAGQPDAARAPYALHRAVARLRRDHPAQPRFWVPYLHFGP
jgi:CHAT domain/Tetratricopeptide repeat